MTVAHNESLAITCQDNTSCSPTLRFIRHNVLIACNLKSTLVLIWRSVVVVFLIQAPVYILSTACDQLDSVPCKQNHLLVWHTPLFVQPLMNISYLFGGPCEQGHVRTIRRVRAAPTNRHLSACASCLKISCCSSVCRCFGRFALLPPRNFRCCNGSGRFGMSGLTMSWSCTASPSTSAWMRRHFITGSFSQCGLRGMLRVGSQ